MSLGNVLIFGDSYSTFEGYIPKGYNCFYYTYRRDVTDVTRLEETWWHQVLSETGSTLLLNDSWSGSTVCNTGYGGDCSNYNSFIYRFEKYKAEGFFKENKVDTVFVFGGTNDNWANSPLGEVKFDGITKDDLFCVLPAMSYLLKGLCKALPNAKIYCLINTDLKSEISSVYNEIAKHYGVTPIQFDFIDKQNGHPTIKGMTDIKNQVLAKL